MESTTPVAGGKLQTPFRRPETVLGRRTSSRTLVAAVISVAGIVISITMWRGLEINDSELHANTIRGEAQAIQREFVTSVESQSRALNRMARRWEAEGGTARARWEADASAHLLDQPAYQAIEWVDPTFRVRWIVPLEGNEAAQDLDLAFEERRRVALLKSKETGERIVTRPVDPAQGGKGFMVYYPLFPRDSFGGFLLGVYRFDRLFETIFAEEPSADFALAVSDGPELVYLSPGANTTLKDDWGESVSLDLLGLPLQAVIWPTPSYLAAQQSTLHEVALALGMFLTAVLVVCAYAAQTALIRGRELAEANRLLAIDITEHERMEESLRELDRMKSAFVDSVSHELRTPLHSITGFSSLMMDGNVPDPDTQRDFLARIHRLSLKLAMLIDDLLDASRIASGSFSIQKQRLSMENLIEEVNSELYGLAQENRILILLDMRHPLPESL